MGDIRGVANVSGEHYLRNPNLLVREMSALEDVNGVSKGYISIRDSRTGGWIGKSAETTFFPEEWSKRRVMQEIEGAFRESKPVLNDNGKVIGWKGTSPSGLDIQGYYGKPEGSAATAWPIYQNRK